MKNDYFVESTLSNASPFPFDIQTQRASGKGVTARSHIHRDIELLYAQKGEFEAYINNDKYIFREGELLVIDAGDIHSVYSVSDDEGSYICIRFALDNLLVYGQRTEENKYTFPFIANFYKKQKVFSSADLDFCDLDSAMELLLKEWKAKEYGFELSVKNIVISVLVGVLRARSGTQGAGELQRLERTGDIAKAFEYIEKNYACDISLNDVADACSMSYSYFSRVFKSITGFKFSEYLLRFRIKEAEYLLVTTNSSVTDIAYSTGFSSSSYFVSKFKLLKGITPKQYRTSMLELHGS